MDPNKTLNMTMLCDFYELTMGNGYLDHNMQDRITYFDVFFRSVPDDGGYAIAAGLEQIIDYIQNLHFTDEDIAYLRGRKLFSEAFLDYLKNFHFTGDIWAVPEGTPVFPREPLITVRAPAIQAQLVETYLLLQINHQSLIATKASRICRAAQGRTVLEFGSRRAQGADGAILGARRLHRRLCRHRLHDLGRGVRRVCRRHDGTLLGADVRLRARRLPRLLPDLPHQRHPARGHLQQPAVRRAERHPRLQ